jgi:thiol-disulfide isomerase/thioredoxin
MKTTNTCILINTEQDLENILKTKDNIFILFYAPWCPFSQRFLPVFEKCAQDTTKQCTQQYFSLKKEDPQND